MKDAVVELATALTSMVFPVPAHQTMSMLDQVKAADLAARTATHP
jgi:hypothetical protein